MQARRGRPPLPDGEQRQTINLRLQPVTMEQLEDLSKRLRTSRARIIERAVAELYPLIMEVRK